MPDTTLRSGLCSVTYRALPAEAVARLAADSGLQAIEWGADIHAPPGDADRLAALRDVTLQHGLTVASYGSYFKAGPHGAEEFAPVLAAAVALGAPRIRVWAGDVGSERATVSQVDSVVGELQAAARWAADFGVEVGLEYHANTLTDSAESTLRLLHAVDRPNVSTYWQPPVGVSTEDALASLTALRERVCGLHVYSWWPGTQRLPLADRRDLWVRALSSVAGRDGVMDALLEFVPHDDPGLLPREATMLNNLIEEAEGADS